uniref:NADH dehydrogenase [ubiquinone] 1 alpha subcomplex subunit 10, mitochondrial n=1 Tax=Hemiscolopendra marginata TaxID=943146 RepID=A0A646QDH4_9MYRI
MIVSSLRCITGSSRGTLLKQVCLLKNKMNNSNILQCAFITTKTMRGEKKLRPAPFPYKEKKLSYFRCWFMDNLLKRFDENTKLLVVEGSIASGKSAVAKQLADELDMLYMPEVTMDMKYINEYGYDLRQLDDQLGESAKSCDVKKYYQNPHHMNVAKFQLSMYMYRFIQYMDALKHILNTGQGVILERCVYSDVVFLETMHKFNYLSKGVKSYYYEVKRNTIDELIRPHLVIYLDVPVNILMNRIKQRNIDYEVNSKVLTKEYLTGLENEYRKYLNFISEHAELLVYDWSNFGDIEVVAEDIERLDFDQYGIYDNKLKDWRIEGKGDWDRLRMKYTAQQDSVLMYFNVPRFDVPEILMTTDDAEVYHDLVDNAPGNKYIPGYNADMGDKWTLFKTKVPPIRYVK